MRAGSLRAGCTRPQPSNTITLATDDAGDASAAARSYVRAAASQASADTLMRARRMSASSAIQCSTLAGPQEAGWMHLCRRGITPHHGKHGGGVDGADEERAPSSLLLRGALLLAPLCGGVETGPRPAPHSVRVAVCHRAWRGHQATSTVLTCCRELWQASCAPPRAALLPCAPSVG